MSAIEMMDPKMDAGMIGNQVNRKVLNLEQAIKVHSHFIKTVSYKTVIYEFKLGILKNILKYYSSSSCGFFFVGRCHQGERPQSPRTHWYYRHMFLLSGEFIMFIGRTYV